jgi:hypothetical protein
MIGKAVKKDEFECPNFLKQALARTRQANFLAPGAPSKYFINSSSLAIMKLEVL